MEDQKRLWEASKMCSIHFQYLWNVQFFDTYCIKPICDHGQKNRFINADVIIKSSKTTLLFKSSAPRLPVHIWEFTVGQENVCFSSRKCFTTVKLGLFSVHFLFWDLKFYLSPCFSPHTLCTATGVFKHINNSTIGVSNAFQPKNQSLNRIIIFFLLKMLLKSAVAEMCGIFTNLNKIYKVLQGFIWIWWKDGVK